jgi:cytochrome bd-type quinol oxidase subunit 1
MPARGFPSIGPREYAMLMIAIGLISLALAALQNWQHRKRMRESGLKAPLSHTTLAAMLVSALGLLSFVAVVLGW